MPNSYEHSVAGCVSGLSLMGILELISQSNAIQKDQYLRINWVTVIEKSVAGAVVGTIAGNIPDILEPAINPHHRQFYHSKSAAVLVIAGLGKIVSSKMDTVSKQLLISFIAAYLLHLNDDSKTVLGLPMI